jgi:hypothetical protein
MFYFISFYNNHYKEHFCKVIDEHPITWYNGTSYSGPSDVVLLNWKQISEEEYNMWGEE